MRFKVGQPFVDGGKVTGKVTSQGRHKKIKIIKFKRRKHQMKANRGIVNITRKSKLLEFLAIINISGLEDGS